MLSNEAIMYYANHPVEFVEDVIGAKPDKEQAKILNSIVRNQMTSVRSGHGHTYNQDHLPPLQENDILIHGHTHVLRAEQMDGYILLNPGSVSIPKEGNPPTYAVLEGNCFTIKDFDGNTVREMRLP